MSESKADELRRLALRSVDWSAQAHALAESSQGLTGSARRDAADEWWVIVRALQVVNASLRDMSAADLLAALADATEQGRAAGDAAGYARGANRTARAMVAALYWRAGEAEARAHRYRTHEAAWDYYNSEAMFLRSAAQAMGLHL